MTVSDLVDLSSGPYPDEAIEAAKVVLIHDLASAMAGRTLAANLVEPPAREHGEVTDLLTGGRVDVASAVSRNGQLIHMLTQDDTLLPAMTHVGATSIPVLLALAELEDVDIAGLTNGLAAAFATAERLGRPVAAALSSRGVRPTPVVGPSAAMVGAGAMLGWPAERVARAISKTAAVAFGTTQAWIEGSQEWLFHISSAGLHALFAARSSQRPTVGASDPFWGKAGVFTALGITPAETARVAEDPRTAVLRANLKRFPVCACNQVPLVLLQQVLGHGDGAAPRRVTALLAPAEANYPGVSEIGRLDTWSRRLMSLPYAMAVMSATGGFGVPDLLSRSAVADDARVADMSVVAHEPFQIGEYSVSVEFSDGSRVSVDGRLADVGAPVREELRHAATASAGERFVEAGLAVLDNPSASVRDFLAELTEIAEDRP